MILSGRDVFTGLAVLVALAGCAVPPQSSPRPTTPPAAPAVSTAPLDSGQTAQDQEFAAFVKAFRQNALAAGIAPETYDTAMAGARFEGRILNRNASQPEFVKPIWTYIDEAVLPRIAIGRAKIEASQQVLTAIEEKYGVPKEIVVSIWGNETDFGKVLGRNNIFSALATLSFKGPRVGFARPQLLAALAMMQRQHLNPNDMVSSWAGAFGQTQFVPTSFLTEAVDGDGDGVIDLWHSSADALASTAHLLADAGWARGRPWGYEVRLPSGFAFELADPNTFRPLSDWTGLSVTRADGTALSETDTAALFLPAGATGPAFLLTPNFKTILKYNAATSYALAVCLLADRMKGVPDLTATWPRGEPQMTRAERIAVQQALKLLGFDPGPTDGVMGTKTRTALRAYQVSRQLPADGFASQALSQRLTADAGLTAGPADVPTVP